MSDDYVPYKDRPEWADVQPIQPDDGPSPVCVIAYDDEFKDVMNYFRAVLHSGEKSERVLSLLNEVIEVNAANYTAWHYRRQTLEALNSDLKAELELITAAGHENPKNYQIWHHRQCIVEKLNDPSGELDYIAKQIEADSKNYHAWSYRQWVLKHFNIFEKELEYLDGLLAKDPRNNSAWNQRYFVITNTTGWTEEVAKQEIEFAQGYIAKAPNNQSPWSYLRGAASEGELNLLPGLKDWLEESVAKWPTCAHVRSCLVDIWEAEDTEESRAKAKEMCEELADKTDQMKEKYWLYRKTLIK